MLPNSWLDCWNTLGPIVYRGLSVAGLMLMGLVGILVLLCIRVQWRPPPEDRDALPPRHSPSAVNEAVPPCASPLSVARKAM